MIVLSFKTKKDKEHLLEKARKMEEYAAMIVDCIEESRHSEVDTEYPEMAYRHHEVEHAPYHEEPYYEERGRYGYRRRMR